MTTPDSSPGSGETLQMEATPGVASTASGISQATLAPNLPAAPTVESGISVVQGEEGVCRGVLEAVTVENLLVPQGASCTLDGTRVEGNIKVENDASLTAHGVTVIGNIQAEGASMVEVLAGSTVGGSIQLKQGGSARVENVIVNGDSSSSLIMVY